MAGAHPALQPAQYLLELGSQHQQVGKLGQLRRTDAKVGLHGCGEHGAMLVQHALHAQQTLLAQHGRHFQVLATGQVLQVNLLRGNWVHAWPCIL